MTDLHFSPPLAGIGMLQWSRFDSIVERGCEHAVEVLDAAGATYIADAAAR